jgi:hypothetical protein
MTSARTALSLNGKSFNKSINSSPKNLFMKKSIFAGLGITLPMLAIGLISYGQATAAVLSFSNNISSAESSASTTNVSTLHPGNVHSKAVRNFVRSYKNVSNEKWYNVHDGFIAMFILDDINYRVDYDKKGNWLHTMRTYDENKLPPDVRHLVKSSYYDYNIMVVQEIEIPRETFTYVVHLEGKTKLINLRVSNGEMDEWQKFDKSK